MMLLYTRALEDITTTPGNQLGSSKSTRFEHLIRMGWGLSRSLVCAI